MVMGFVGSAKEKVLLPSRVTKARKFRIDSSEKIQELKIATPINIY